MQIKLPYFRQLSLSLFTAFLLTACDAKAPISQTQTEPEVRLAKLFTVTLSTSNDFLNYPAVINSQKLSKLSFEVGGVLKELMVVEAQKVKKGEILAKLDQEDLQAKLKSAQSQYKNSDTEYKRALRLIKEDAISKSKFEERKSKRDVSKSSLEIAQKALKNSLLIAPYDGSISKVSIKKQQIVQAGESAIDILGKGGMEAKINLPSSIIAKSKAQKEHATDSYIILDASPDLHIPILFKEASLEADASSQTYEVTFTFDAPNDLIILPGMNAVVWFKDPSIGTTAKKITAPLTAIASDGDKKYVWVVDKNSMSVSKKSVVIESDVGTNVSILNGLEEGDTIVSAGVSFLSEGIKVTPWSK